MARLTCPTCGRATMESVTIPRWETKFEGVTICVTDAHVSRCPACGAKSYSAAELRRWKKIKQAVLESSGQALSADDVRQVRESLGLSISDFALLLSVTRQTVHTWERPDTGRMTLGPAALLILLLRAERKGTTDGVYSRLVALAHRRAQLEGIDVKAPAIVPENATQQQPPADYAANG